MLDWKNYRLKLKNRIGAFGKLQPKTLQGYQALRWLYYRACGSGNQSGLHARGNCRGIGCCSCHECRCGNGLFGACA